MYSGELHSMDSTIYVQWRIPQHGFNNIHTVENYTAWIQQYTYSGELHSMDSTIYVWWRITHHGFNNIRTVENYTAWIQDCYIFKLIEL